MRDETGCSVKQLSCGLRVAHEFGETPGIARGVAPGIVVEVDVNVSTSSHRWTRPTQDAVRPPLELLVRVAARVEHPRAVQSHVHEIGGQLLYVRKHSRAVGHDQGAAAAAEQLVELLGQVRSMPHLDGVAKAA